MCIDKLTQLGFSEKEAQVYLMLFRMGPSPVSALAQRVDLKRVTVYALLDALKTRGLVNTVDTDQGRRYVPQDPSCLMLKLEEEKNTLDRKMQMAEEYMKELESPIFSGVPELKRVHFHVGVTSVKKGLSEYFLTEAPLNALLPMRLTAETELCLAELHEERDKEGALTVFQRVNAKLFTGGILLVLEDTVGFMALRGDLELMIIRDPFYAQYVKRVLFSPYFSKNSVGASISKAAPVKG